jgi:hypothetical protein
LSGVAQFNETSTLYLLFLGITAEKLCASHGDVHSRGLGGSSESIRAQLMGENIAKTLVLKLKIIVVNYLSTNHWRYLPQLLFFLARFAMHALEPAS